MHLVKTHNQTTDKQAVKRIGIEAQRLFRAQKHGMDIVVLNILLELQKLDKHNHYFIFSKPGPDSACLPKQHNFTCIEIESTTYADWEQIKLPAAINKLHLDVVHYTANTAPIYSSVKSVLTLHDVIFLERKGKDVFSGSWYQKLGTLYRKLIVPFAIKNAHKIVTISATERNNILTHFSDSESKLDVVYNGIDSNYFDLPLHSHQVTANLNLPDRYMFAIGNTDPRKNTKGLIEAFSVYAENNPFPLHLVLVGYPKLLVNKILKELNAESVASLIHCLDYVSSVELPYIYSMSRFFVFPSFREGFGLPPLEAMARQVPVIASNASCIPEVCSDAARYINPNNISEMVAAFYSLDFDEDLRTQLIEKGNRRAASFSWKDTATKFHSIYQTV